MSGPSEKERGFAEYLAGLAEREDRAALAALRRGLGKAPGEAAEMYPYLVPWLPRERWGEETYYLVASLFGWHPLPWRGAGADGERAAPTNLGASLTRLGAEVEGGGIERRFVALLNAHRDDLPEHLRRAVGLLKSRDLPIDWARLLHDVQGWDFPSRSVQRDWARAYWGHAAGREVEPAAEVEEVGTGAAS